MESLINNMDLSDIVFGCLFLGMLFNMFQDVIFSLIDYIQCRIWRMNDYERIIYLLNKENSLSFNDKDFETMYEAINNYTITLEREEKRKEKREKFLNKFRKNK